MQHCIVLCTLKWKHQAFCLSSHKDTLQRITLLIICTCWENWNCDLHWTYFIFILACSNLFVWYLSAFLSFCAECANCEYRRESGIPGSSRVVSDGHVQPLPVWSAGSLLLHCVGERPQHQAAWRECPHRHPGGQHFTPHSPCVIQGSVGFTSQFMRIELKRAQL